MKESVWYWCSSFNAKCQKCSANYIKDATHNLEDFGLASKRLVGWFLNHIVVPDDHHDLVVFLQNSSFYSLFRYRYNTCYSN